MAPPIVHIGYHKTATTWFQKALYPAVRNRRFIPRDQVVASLISDTAFRFSPEEARRRLELSTQAADVILCEESLSGYLHNGGLAGFLSKEMAQRIHAVLPEAQIIVFIRRQPDMIAACYQQYMRGGGTHSPRRYLFPQDYLEGAIAHNYKVPRFSFDHFAYDGLIAHYDRIFGRENVHVMMYEKFREDPRGFLESFTGRFDLAVDLDRISMRSANVSYCMPVIWLARVLNRFTARTVGDKRYLIHIPFWYPVRRGILEVLNRPLRVMRPPTPERLLGRRTVDWIAARYAESNNRLLELRDLPLAKYGYPLSAPASPPPRPRRPRWLRWTAY